jgi:hypothetical protein
MKKGLWKIIIQSKYSNKRTLRNAFIFWKEVNKERDIFNISINKHIGNGQQILFWKDRWLGECTLSVQFPLLYDIASDPEIKVSQVIGHNRFYLSFNRNLTITLNTQLLELYNKLAQVQLGTEEDSRCIYYQFMLFLAGIWRN